MIDSGNDLTTFDLVNRIVEHRTKFLKRNQEKEQKEMKLIESMNKSS